MQISAKYHYTVLRTATVPAILAGYMAHRRRRQFGGVEQHYARKNLLTMRRNLLY